MNRLSTGCCLLALSITLWAPRTLAADPEDLIVTINSVGRNGKGHLQAAQAMRELTKMDAKVLPTILKSLKDANPLAANWLHSAFETIADREIRQGNTAGLLRLERFVLDRHQNPRARRLAFEWLARVDNTAADRLIPGMVTDPSPEFRRDAVARLIDSAGRLQQKGQIDKAVATYREAFRGATDDDQVQAIVKPLKKLGHEVDLRKHFGFLTRWHVIGPFDNRDKIGFDAVYPPEKQIDLKETYKGQLGDVRWNQVSTDDDYGIFDIAKAIKNHKGSVMPSEEPCVTRLPPYGLRP